MIFGPRGNGDLPLSTHFAEWRARPKIRIHAQDRRLSPQGCKGNRKFYVSRTSPREHAFRKGRKTQKGYRYTILCVPAHTGIPAWYIFCRDRSLQLSASSLSETSLMTLCSPKPLRTFAASHSTGFANISHWPVQDLGRQKVRRGDPGMWRCTLCA